MHRIVHATLLALLTVIINGTIYYVSPVPWGFVAGFTGLVTIYYFAL